MLQALHDEKVRFLLVGAYAIILLVISGISESLGYAQSPELDNYGVMVRDGLMLIDSSSVSL